MSWTMPHRVLQVVASLIVLAALGSFTMGVLNAPQRGRLPGQKPDSTAEAGAPVDATDATPLSQARIEGAPPPPPAKEKPDEDQNAEDQADEPDQAPVPLGNIPAPQPGNGVGAAPPPSLGAVPNNIPPGLEEPPH
jgi:hypothetical protein